MTEASFLTWRSASNGAFHFSVHYPDLSLFSSPTLMQSIQTQL